MTTQRLDELVAEVRAMMKERWTLGPLHGVTHWERVERNGILLAEPGVNLTVVRLFAYLHDSCRENDGYDVEHGPRAARFITTLCENLLSELTDEEFDQLCRACYNHTTSHSTDDVTVNTCFDADRLDLGRVAITPDPERMATPRGRQFAADPAHFATLCAAYAQSSAR